MKKKLITVALIATLNVMAVSCQKETFFENENLVSAATGKYKIYYTVDGTRQMVELKNEQDLALFMDEMALLARRGHSISINNNSAITTAAKEKIIYTTQNHYDAVTWCAKMYQDGYTVTMDYDDNTKTYTCTATK